MNEETIRAFFEGMLTARELNQTWAQAFAEEPRSDGTVVRRLRTEPLAESYPVTVMKVGSLIDAVLDGSLGLSALDAICFAMEASDKFEWNIDTDEGERVGRSLFWLGSPEVNYPLTPTVLSKIRNYVLTGADTLTRDDLTDKTSSSRVINEWESKRGA